jgi:hypothetical protein
LKIKKLLGLLLITAQDSQFFQAVPFWRGNFFHIFFHKLIPELGHFFQRGLGQQKDPDIRGLLLV